MNLLFFFKPGLYVSKRTIIQGNVSTDDHAYIAGIINGDVIVRATLMVEKSGLINGNVQAKDIIVKGKIKGKIRSDGKVDIVKKGEVEGHVYAIEVNVDKESLLKGDITKLHNPDAEDDDAEEINSSINVPAVSLPKPDEEEAPQSWF